MTKTRRPRKATPAKVAPATEPDATRRLAGERGPELLAVGEDGRPVMQSDTPPPASGPVKDPRLCPVVNCDRVGHDHLLGMCGAHYASRRGDHV